MKNSEKLLQITNHFGARTEAIKLQEEVGEFIDLIGEGVHKEVTLELTEKLEEEAADVMVVFGQLVNYFNLDTDKIKEIANRKIDRTIQRIESGWYDKHR